MNEASDTFPIHARVDTSEISLGAVPASKYKRKVFNLVLSEHSGSTNYIDILYVSGGVTSTMRLHIGAYDLIDIPKEKVASIECDPNTELRARTGATSIDVLAVVQDI